MNHPGADHVKKEKLLGILRCFSQRKKIEKNDSMTKKKKGGTNGFGISRRFHIKLFYSM
jgi:hypothetical protein